MYALLSQMKFKQQSNHIPYKNKKKSCYSSKLHIIFLSTCLRFEREKKYLSSAFFPSP